MVLHGIWYLYYADRFYSEMTEAIKYQRGLPHLPQTLFWDIHAQAPDYKNHAEWVIRRVFERGSLEDIAEIILFYGKGKIKKAMTTAPHLDEDILYLASAILAVPLTDFQCYTTNQYRKIF